MAVEHRGGRTAETVFSPEGEGTKKAKVKLGAQSLPKLG